MEDTDVFDTDDNLSIPPPVEYDIPVTVDSAEDLMGSGSIRRHFWWYVLRCGPSLRFVVHDQVIWFERCRNAVALLGFLPLVRDLPLCFSRFAVRFGDGLR